MTELEDNLSSRLQRPTTDNGSAWPAYWQFMGQDWRTEPEIDKKRQEYLEQCSSIVPDIKQSIYPFKGIKLSRADVEWLLATYEGGRGPVDWSDKEQRERRGLDLRGADLRQVDLRKLPLAKMRGGLIEEEFKIVTVERFGIARVHMDQANLREAYLEGANLERVHLERAILMGARLAGANLRNAYFNTVTNLEHVMLGDMLSGFVSLADVHWDGVNLAVVDWKQMQILGDELEARLRKTNDAEIKDKTRRLDEYERAIRANRQLAIVLQSQGLSDVAAHFIYRAQILQRWVLWQHKNIGQYLFSLLLDLLAGYGFKPIRSIFSYLIIIFGFMGLYLLNAHFVAPQLSWDEALVLSVSSFHGRGFFTQNITLGDTYARLAAAEAVV